MTKIPRTKDQLRVAVEDSGSKFFTPGAMRFFSSRLCAIIGADAHGHVHFVTSEQNRGYQARRFYTIRKFDGVSVDTVGTFQYYHTRESAIVAGRAITAGHMAPK